MPSGSHGGGGGFGGHGGFTGSSFGGGSRSSRSSGGVSHRPRGPRYFHFGHRTLIITTGRQSVISIFIFFIVMALMFMFSLVSTRSSYKEELSMIEEEYRYYQDMIVYAEANKDDGYVIKAKVKETQYSTELGKYRFIYSFKTDNGSIVNGYTFYIYDLENMPRTNQEFDLAVDSVPVTSNTDSIPVDYKNTVLEDDAAYTYLKAEIKSVTIYIVLSVVVVIGLVGAIALVVFTSKKKEEEQKEEEKQKEIIEEKKKYCEYCGTKINEEDKICPQCGARLK